MSLITFLEQVTKNETISFHTTITIINENYDYHPTEFSNGLDEDKLSNAAGTNEGSCKIFSFAKINQLSRQQTLNLFGDYYTVEVLQDPNGSGHQNIRNFMKYGWEGIQFDQLALTPK